MTTLTFPLSRIEGHAQVVIELRGSEVVSAHFQATELRGFQHFVRGVPAAEMPVLTPRVCGVCSTAHHVAAVRALESAYGVEPPPLARRIRELMLLGQLIQNQATSLFLFTMPDWLGAPSLFGLEPAALSATEAPVDLSRRALAVRRAGTSLITTAGGQFIHPVNAVVGGVVNGIGPEAADRARAGLSAALELASELVAAYWKLTFALRERIGTWGDDAPTSYLAAVERERPAFVSDRLHILDADGTLVAAFPPAELWSRLRYEETDYSYAGRTTYQGGIIRANSLARMNLVSRMGTARADEWLGRFREAFGQPAHAILLFDLARCIELVYALERALELLAEPLTGEPTSVSYEPRDGEGFGLVEAPRGPLVHRYVLRDGKVQDAEFVIPTVHNVAGIERALRVATARYVRDGHVSLELEAAVGRVVRAFDPCIACATH